MRSNVKRLVFIVVGIYAFIGLSVVGSSLALSQEAPSAPQSAPAQVSGGLFTDPGPVPPMPSSITGRAEVVRSRFTAVDFSLANVRPTTLTLNLFGNAALTAVNQSIEAHSAVAGGFTWVGKVAGKPYSDVVLSFAQGTMFGHINAGDAVYEVNYSGSGRLHIITEIDLDKLPPCAGGLTPPPATPVPAPQADLKPAANAPRLADMAPDGSPIIDVLVVYTAQTRSAAGGTTAMLNAINTAVSLANTGYANSLVNQRIRLARAVEVSYTETGNIFTDLERLAGTSDGYMDEVHGLRNTYRADLVTLFVETSAYCGLAYLMTNVSPGFAPNGFNVVVRNCISNLSFAHELGHNMGSAHDIANSGGPGAYSYSYGYQDPGKNFRTIMAYNCPGGCPRVNWFSNPSVQYNGLPTGTANANNALSLNNTASTVANFRTYRDTVGIFRPSNATFYLRNSHTTGPADLTAVMGTPTDLPIVGDWDGDGVSTIGVFRPSTGQWFLKNANTTAAPVVYSFFFGADGDRPVAGDWDGNGTDGIGVFRNGRFLLRNALSTGGANYTITFGTVSDQPVAGDWNGDGVDSPGLYRGASFLLTNTMCANCTGALNYSFTLGILGDVGFAGDWDDNGADGVGVFRPTNGITYMKNALSTGFADVFIIYGIAGDMPVAGRWANTGTAPDNGPQLAPTFEPGSAR